MEAPMYGDLITQKTIEFDALPGLILGLDGWILRSVPKELREQFLRGYEKLLRTVFHPDRYSDEEKKQSRQTYLQSVSEAVRFMTNDELSFDLAVDVVPTKRNPVISLKRDLEARDKILQGMDAKFEEQAQYNRIASEKLKTAVEELRVAQIKQKGRDSADYRMRKALYRAVKKYPVPVDMAYIKVTGHFVKPIRSDFCEWLGGHASIYSVDPDSPENVKQHWIKSIKKKNLGPEETLIFRRGTTKIQRLSMHTLGAMTLTHLAEYIRDHQGYPTKKLEAEAVVSCLTDLIQEHKDQFLAIAETSSFLSSFYAPGMFLLLETIDWQQILPANRTHPLFLVTSTSVDANLYEAELQRHKREKQLVIMEKSQLRKEVKRLRKRMNNNRDALDEIIRLLKTRKPKSRPGDQNPKAIPLVDLVPIVLKQAMALDKNMIG